MDEKKLFDGHAKAYTAGRPGYAKKLIDCLYRECVKGKMNCFGISKLTASAALCRSGTP